MSSILNDPEDLNVYYTYDSDGLRTSKTVNGVKHEYLYDGDKVVYEKRGEDQFFYYYDSYGHFSAIRHICAADNTDYIYYANTNSRGDVVGLYTGPGVQIVSYEYDAWGNVISMTDTTNFGLGSLNPIRYRGYYYDEETNWYYLQSRYYDPEIGRFINADSVIDKSSVIGSNLFLYCLNNPVNMTDGTGNLPFLVITAAVGAVIGAVVGGVAAAKNGGNVWAGIGIGAAAGALIGAGAGMAAGAVLAGSVTATTGAVLAGGSTLASTVAAGGLGAGATYIANNLQQAGNEISNAIATVTQKVVTKTPPANPGKPFEPGKTGIQYGVDPNTLIPKKDLSTLNPQRMADAVKYAGDQAIIVSRTGVIQDGHHRAAYAIMNGRAIDIFVEPYA